MGVNGTSAVAIARACAVPITLLGLIEPTVRIDRVPRRAGIPAIATDQPEEFRATAVIDDLAAVTTAIREHDVAAAGTRGWRYSVDATIPRSASSDFYSDTRLTVLPGSAPARKCRCRARSSSAHATRIRGLRPASPHRRYRRYPVALFPHAAGISRRVPPAHPTLALSIPITPPAPPAAAPGQSSCS
jgi:hypothetical protein